MSISNISYDLIWQVTRANSNYLVKRTDAGGVRFSTDPLNATGVYDQKHASFANSHAYGVQKTPEGIKLLSKDNSNWNKPNKAVKVASFDSNAAVRDGDVEVDAAVRKAEVLNSIKA